jgi:hypothetical protein
VTKEQATHCPECGAALADEPSCDELFHKLLAWELSDLARNGRYHHLLVLSWELQHPSRFADRTITWARESLHRSIVDGVPARQLRRDAAEWQSQDRRTFKITRDDAEVVHREWTQTLGDVIAKGEEGMPESVLEWATAVLKDVEHDEDDW